MAPPRPISVASPVGVVVRQLGQADRRAGRGEKADQQRREADCHEPAEERRAPVDAAELLALAGADGVHVFAIQWRGVPCGGPFPCDTGRSATAVVPSPVRLKRSNIESSSRNGFHLPVFPAPARPNASG